MNKLGTTLALLAASLVPTEANSDSGRSRDGIVTSRHDVCEYNNLYDSDGNATLDQIIIWRWDARNSAYRVVDWRMVDTKKVKAQRETKEKKTVTEVINGERRGVRKWVDTGIQEFDDLEPTRKGQSMIPTRNPRTGKYEAIWHDGDIMRKTIYDSFNETYTDFDPELEDREFLPKERREGLPNPIRR